MKKIIVVLLLCNFITAPAFSQNSVPEEERALTKEMLDLTGAKQLAVGMATQVSNMGIDSIKKTNPNIDPQVLAALNDELNAVLKEEFEKDSFNEMSYPIYAKHFTVDELKEINAFYKTPIGKKLIKATPQIAQESMMASQTWMRELAPKIQERLKVRFEKMTKKP